MRSITIVLSTLLLGCSSPLTESDDGRVLGAIAGYHKDDPQIEIMTAPGSATVKVTTYGGGCHSKGETEVQLRGREAVVTPYDYLVAPPGTACTLQLISFVHEATINFGTTGPAQILVRGVDRRRRGETITVERTVVIP